MASAAANMLRDFGFTLAPAVIGAAALKQAAGAVTSGPLGANAVPDPTNPIKEVAFQALGSANSVGYVICGIAGLVAALLVVVALGGGSRNSMITAESLDNQR